MVPRDETRAEERRGRTGPRHAAPRKPLLARLHMPAGKAVAMVAMPSAVLMGMGLTPQLASAKPLPKNPFRDGPCVSAPDREPQKRAPEKPDAEKPEAEKPDAEKEGEKEKGEPPAAPEPSDPPEPEPGPEPEEEPEPEPAPEPEPEGEPERNPLDPLGWGEKLKDLFTPGEEAAAETAPKAPPEEAPEAEAPPADNSGAPTADPGADAEEKDEAEEKGEAKEPPAPAASEEPPGSAADADGKKPYPCVEKKKVEGDDDQTPAVLPNQPWYLEASSLGLHDLKYEGVVNVTMANGKSKQALKFTTSGLDIGDLHQIVAGPGGTKYHVEAGPGTTSTIREGRVTMYTERLEGRLFGLIPVVFDPEHPPPLVVPELYFTKVKVTQAGQFGGTLTIPGLHQSITR